MIDWNWKVPERIIDGITLGATIAGACFAAWSVGAEIRKAPDGSIGFALSGLAVAILSCLGVYSAMLDKLAPPQKLAIRLTIGFVVSIIGYGILATMLAFGWRAA